MTYRVAIVFVSVVLTSCATATYSPLDICSGSVKEVKVLRSFPPDGTYKKCGSIQIEGGGLSSEETNLDAARDSARKHGANAIVIIKNPDRQDFTLAKGNAREGSAIAIRINHQ